MQSIIFLIVTSTQVYGKNYSYKYECALRINKFDNNQLVSKLGDNVVGRINLEYNEFCNTLKISILSPIKIDSIDHRKFGRAASGRLYSSNPTTTIQDSEKSKYIEHEVNGLKGKEMLITRIDNHLDNKVESENGIRISVQNNAKNRITYICDPEKSTWVRKPIFKK